MVEIHLRWIWGRGTTEGSGAIKGVIGGYPPRFDYFLKVVSLPLLINQRKRDPAKQCPPQETLYTKVLV